jgi:hypothetical protein
LKLLSGVTVGMIRGILLCANTSYDYCVDYFRGYTRLLATQLSCTPGVAECPFVSSMNGFAQLAWQFTLGFCHAEAFPPLWVESGGIRLHRCDIICKHQTQHIPAS